jgi:hypothetical protein
LNPGKQSCAPLAYRHWEVEAVELGIREQLHPLTTQTFELSAVDIDVTKGDQIEYLRVALCLTAFPGFQANSVRGKIWPANGH